MKQSELPKIIAQSFNESELRSLLFEMGLSYDDFGGEGNLGKAREIVAYFIRRNEAANLIAKIIQVRPSCFRFVQRQDCLPKLPSASRENGDEAFYRFLRDTLYSVEKKTDRMGMHVAIAIAMSIINFVLVLSLIV